jgi:HK97 family phage major capsid protein
MLTTNQKLIQLSTEKSDLLHRAQTALDTKGAKSPEYKALIAEAETVQGDLDMLNLIERKMPLPPAPSPVAAPAVIAAPAIITETFESRKRKTDTAYRHYLRNGFQPNAVEQRDIITTVADGGAALIPQGYQDAYTSALKLFGPIASLVKQTTAEAGFPQKYPVNDDTASTMSYTDESGSADGLEEDPSLNSVITGTDALVTLIRYSFEMLSDSFSLESFIRDIGGIRIGRAVEYALLTGKDNGTVTQLPNSPTAGLIGNVSAGITAGSGTLAAGPTYSLLSQLKGSVDHAYAVGPNAGFLGSQSVYDFLIQQVDSTGRPLYKHNRQTGLLEVAGSPFYVASNAAMPAYNAASSKTVLFGDFSRSYAYLNGGGMKIRILKERFANVLEGAAVIYHRMGAATLVPGAVKALVTSAS